jgi:hypothetical protein
MEKSDAANAKSGISAEVLREIDAQHAILSYVVKLINQPPLNSSERSKHAVDSGQWVYDMDGLQNWVHHFTERKRLTCPKCKAATTVKCEICDEVYEYHDEL